MSADQKIKTAAKKAAIALIPWRFLLGVARVFMYGAKKYAPGNWFAATLDDGAGERYVSATLRHLGEMQGPDGLWTPESLAARDDESGLPHIDHAICSLVMLRGIMVKAGAVAADPGEAKEPPTVAIGGWVVDRSRPPGERCVDINTGEVVPVVAFDCGGSEPIFVRADTAIGRAPAPIAKDGDPGYRKCVPLRDWATIERVVLDHPDPDRPLPPRDVVEAEYRAERTAAELDRMALIHDLEAPEPAADAVTVVEDVAKAAEERYQRLLAHRVAQGAYDVEPKHVPLHGAQPAAADRIVELLQHANGGPLSFAYFRSMVSWYGGDLFDVLGVMVADGTLVKDAAGYSLGGGKTPAAAPSVCTAGVVRCLACSEQCLGGGCGARV